MAVIVAVVGLLLGGITAYAGMYPPFTVVNSGSMQHSEESDIGTVDAGDMMIVQKNGKHDIVTYVEGAQTGYVKFGEYGDVLVYDHPNREVNIIHRAMIELELQSNDGNVQVWHIPSLKNDDQWQFNNVFGTDMKNTFWNPEECTLTIPSEQKTFSFMLTDVGYAGIDTGIRLWELGTGHDSGYKGYLTKGDNAETNRSFDQNGIIDQLVTEDMIVSTAEIEIPWLGCIKLLMKDDLSQNIPPNSLPNLIITIIVILIAIFGGSYAVGYIMERRNPSENEEKDENKYVRKSKQRK